MRAVAFAVAVAFIVAVAVCFAVSNGQGTGPSTGNPDAPAPRFPTFTISYDSIKALAQPNPRTNTEKSALKFKPRIYIEPGECYPYAAVTENGRTSSSLPRDKSRCATVQGQVYGRAGWAGSNWGTLYTWFVPTPDGPVFKNVFVWINNPSSSIQRVVSVSTQNASNHYISQDPNGATFMTGNHVEVIYANNLLSVNPNGDGADYNLIMWDQLSDAAKIALNNTSNFDGVQVPFNDINFDLNLYKASYSTQRVAH